MTEPIETLMSELDEVRARVDALGCPEFDFSVLRRRMVGAPAPEQPALAWAKANPGLARERDALLQRLGELEADIRRARDVRDGLRTERQALLALGVGERTLEALDSEPSDTPALKAVKAIDGAWVLVLTGGVGTGKTLAAAFALREAYRNDPQRGGWVGERIPAARWISSPRASREPQFGDEAQAREAEWIRCRLLVIDDVGAEFASAPWAACLAAVLDARWDNRRRTILTSNLSVSELRERLGARTWDRLAQEGRIVGCGDVSLRRRSA